MTRCRLLAVAVAVTSALLVPAAAAATPAPCWQRLLNDYYDNGRIDHVYTAVCYTEAIKRIPRPLRDYSDAYDVLTRSLQAALGSHHGKNRQNVPVPPSSSPPSPPGGAAGGSTSPGPGGAEAPFTRVADTGSGDATTVPLPLLVLAGLGLALTAGGAVVALLRRRRAP